jgi:hypothetical protein
VQRAHRPDSRRRAGEWKLASSRPAGGALGSAQPARSHRSPVPDARAARRPGCAAAHVPRARVRRQGGSEGARPAGHRPAVVPGPQRRLRARADRRRSRAAVPQALGTPRGGAGPHGGGARPRPHPRGGGRGSPGRHAERRVLAGASIRRLVARRARGSAGAATTATDPVRG